MQLSANAVSPGSGKIIFDGSSETTLQGNLAGFVVDDDGDENIECEDESSVNSAIMESNAEVPGRGRCRCSKRQKARKRQRNRKPRTLEENMEDENVDASNDSNDLSAVLRIK